MSIGIAIPVSRFWFRPAETFNFYREHVSSARRRFGDGWRKAGRGPKRLEAEDRLTGS